MIEIKAGPELDKAVADAIGDEPALPFSIARAMAGEEGFTYNLYSTDLNAAFAAAEKVGMLEATHCLRISKQPEDLHPYLVCFTDGHDIATQTNIVVEEDTPALAICAAILNVKERP